MLTKVDECVLLRMASCILMIVRGKEKGPGPLSIDDTAIWPSFVQIMPRTNRLTPGGMVFHVLNRGEVQQRLFQKPADHEPFEVILEETPEKTPMRVCNDCLMPNHWHFGFVAGTGL